MTEATVGRLAGRVAIVTGSATGLGAAFARGFAGQGAAVSLCDVNDPSAVANEIRALGGHAIATVTDVSSAKAVEIMVTRTEREFGRIDALVNNAAISTPIPARRFEDIPSDEWDRVMAVNARGAFECAKAVVPIMRLQRYGKILNLSSTTVFKGLIGVMHYVASKGAIIAMTRVMARELGEFGICVNCIAPGVIETESMVADPAKAASLAAAPGTRAIQRAASPRDLVGAAVFLVSSESDFITGQTLPIDGGVVLH